MSSANATSTSADALNRTWTLIPATTEDNQHQGDNNNRINSINKNSSHLESLNLKLKGIVGLKSSNDNTYSSRSGVIDDQKQQQLSHSLFHLTSNDFEMFINRFDYLKCQEDEWVTNNNHQSYFSTRSSNCKFESLFEESLTDIECKYEWWSIASPTIPSSNNENNNNKKEQIDDLVVEDVIFEDGNLQQKNKENLVGMPNSFDLFASDLLSNSETINTTGNQLLIHSSKRFNNIPRQQSGNHQPKIKNKQVEHSKINMKILTSSIDKDLNKKTTPIATTNNNNLTTTTSTPSLNQKSSNNLLALSSSSSRGSVHSLAKLVTGDSEPEFQMLKTSTALNSKSSSMFNLNQNLAISDQQEEDNQMYIDDFDPDPNRSKAVFNKTYTSWSLDDQNVQLEAMNKLNDLSATLNIKNNNNEKTVDLNRTRDLNVTKDIEPEINDLNRTREIIVPSSSASSAAVSISSSQSSSLNNLNQLNSKVTNKTTTGKVVLNRTRSINDDEEDLNQEKKEQRLDTNSKIKNKQLSQMTPNNRISIIKPVIDPPEFLAPLPVAPILNKQPTRLVEPKKISSSSNIEKQQQNKFDSNNSNGKTSIPRVNFKQTTPNSNKISTQQQITKISPVVVASQTSTNTKTNSTKNSPLMSSNIQKFGQSNTVTANNKSNKLASPNNAACINNRLSSSSTSSSSSLKENKKLSSPLSSPAVQSQQQHSITDTITNGNIPTKATATSLKSPIYSSISKPKPTVVQSNLTQSKLKQPSTTSSQSLSTGQHSIAQLNTGAISIQAKPLINNKSNSVDLQKNIVLSATSSNIPKPTFLKQPSCIPSYKSSKPISTFNQTAVVGHQSSSSKN